MLYKNNLESYVKGEGMTRKTKSMGFHILYFVFSVKTIKTGQGEYANMKKVHFEMKTDGFYGAYWKCKNKSDAAMILKRRILTGRRK